MSGPEFGEFVHLRGRTWLVEGVASGHDGLSPLRLACIADDAQGETLDVLWDAEVAASVHRENAWKTWPQAAQTTPRFSGPT